MYAKKNHNYQISLPGWSLVLFMAIYGELLLHIWTNDPIHPGRLLAVLCFAAGFGGILALLVSLIPGKAQKWVSVLVGFLLAVMYLTWYFINESFQIFMTVEMVISGAQGIATGFMSTVIGLLVRDWWRILIYLLPLILFGIFADQRFTTWKGRGILAAVVVLLYALSLLAVRFVSHDTNIYRDTYSFDSAVHAFGLNVGLTLDLFQSSGSREPEFQIVETEPPAVTEPSAPQESQSSEEETETPIVYEPNVMDYDFGELAETCGNGPLAKIHTYVNSQTPTLKNEYTGIFEGKNLIFISAEAFSAEVIDPERTPTLYRLANNGFQFLDYYQPLWGGGTSSGEFANLLGFPGFANCMQRVRTQDFFLDMGFQLGRLGYRSAAYHNNDWKFYNRHLTHFSLGYDTYMGYGNGMEKGVAGTWPQSDLEMLQFTLPQFLEGDEPFNLYYMSVSGHSIYTQDANAMARKNYDVVKDLPCSEPVKCYLAANQELENALAYTVNALEEKGIADDTVIVIAADHYPYGLEPSATWGNTEDCLSELYGRPCASDFIRDHNRLIIWSGCLEQDTGLDLVVDEPTSSLDILPTLSNLFGLHFDSRLLVGRDVFSEAPPLVLWNNFQWKTDKGTYSPDGNKFTPAEGVTVDDDYVRRISAIVNNKLTYTKSVMETDYFRYLAQTGGDPAIPAE